MAMVISVAEFLENVGKLKKKEDKINALRNNPTFPVKTVLQAVFDPRIVWLLPPGEPPYKVTDLVDQENVFIRDCRKLVYFVQGPHPNLAQAKRESMFIEMLETICPKDAKLLVSIKDKKLPFKGITEDIVRAAYPEIFPPTQENTI